VNLKYLTQTFILFLIVLVIAGCQPAHPKTDTIVRSIIEDHTAGRSIQGRSIPCLSFGSGSDVILIMATIHGDENAGTPLTHELIDHLMDNPQYFNKRKVVIMPVSNPDGFAVNSRYNSRGVDLNRNFEAANRENNQVNGFKGLSEPESQFIKKVIAKYNPNRILTLHESLACIDYDGPGDQLAQHLAKYCDLPINKLGSRPGSLGSYAGNTLGIPIITLELTDADLNAPGQVLWSKYGKESSTQRIFKILPA